MMTEPEEPTPEEPTLDDIRHAYAHMVFMSGVDVVVELHTLAKLLDDMEEQAKRDFARNPTSDQ